MKVLATIAIIVVFAVFFGPMFFGATWWSFWPRP